MAANSKCNLHPLRCSSESIHTLQSVTTNHTASPEARKEKLHTGSVSQVMGLCEVNNSISLLRDALKISNQKQKDNPDKFVSFKVNGAFIEMHYYIPGNITFLSCQLEKVTQIHLIVFQYHFLLSGNKSDIYVYLFHNRTK